jgi:uncharacterized LabA/DUF88 family protein
MIKVGIYIDGENVKRSGGYGLRYDVLMQIGSLGNSTILRANSYNAEDGERAAEDVEYRDNLNSYYSAIRRNGFKLIKKMVKRYRDEEGQVTMKANADMDLAIDALVQSRNLDRIILLTGDGDFVRMVIALQDRGCKVDVIGFNDVSRDLREAADHYYNGFLIPGLLQSTALEGELTGTPLFYNESKGYGKYQFYELSEDGLAERELFFHVTHLVDRNEEVYLTRRHSVWAFTQIPNDRVPGEFMATQVRLIR